MQEPDAASRLAQCESEIIRLRRLVRVSTTLAAAITITVLAGFAAPRIPAAQVSTDSLRVRELTVVDARGVIRARLGETFLTPLEGLAGEYLEEMMPPASLSTTTRVSNAVAM